MGHRSHPLIASIEDQIVAVIREHGPLSTRELADRTDIPMLPHFEEARCPGCSHVCEQAPAYYPWQSPEHPNAPVMMKPVLDRLARQGRIVKMSFGSSHPCLWLRAEPLCESCGRAADLSLSDGSHWCISCDLAARGLGYDNSPATLSESNEGPA